MGTHNAFIYIYIKLSVNIIYNVNSLPLISGVLVTVGRAVSCAFFDIEFMGSVMSEVEVSRSS